VRKGKKAPGTPPRKWLPDESAEQMLRFDFGICNLDRERVRLKDINLDLRDNTRERGLLIDDLVTLYADVLRAGKAMPELVLMRPRGDILGGFHRAKAAEVVGLEDVQALVVPEVEPTLAKFIRISLNNVNGERETPARMRLHALSLVLDSDFDPRDVARRLGLRSEHLNDLLRRERCRREMDEEGVDLAGVTDTNVEMLASVKNQPVRLAIGRGLASAPRVKSHDLQLLLGEVRQARGEKEQLARVASFLREMSTPGGSNVLTRGTLLLRQMRSLCRSVSGVTDLAKELTGSQLPEFQEAYREFVRTVGKCLPSHGKKRKSA
jgi:hypothetical protein